MADRESRRVTARVNHGGRMSASAILTEDEMPQGHVHKFGPPRFGKQLGPAHYEGITDPCSCGLTHDAFLKQAMDDLRRQADAWKTAMAEEHVPDDVAQRVVNRALWGDPDGLFAEEKRRG